MNKKNNDTPELNENSFRVWCKRTKTMQGIGGWFLIDQAGELWSYGPLSSMRKESYEHYDVMFYTCRKDIDGTPIFNGDRIQGNSGTYTIIYKEGVYRCVHDEHEKYYIAKHTWKTKKVIGNIYE